MEWDGMESTDAIGRDGCTVCVCIPCADERASGTICHTTNRAPSAGTHLPLH